MLYRILQNEAKCRKCDDIIWSAHRHDFKTCKCGAISVDGGLDYIRRVYENPEDIQDRSLRLDKLILGSILDSLEEKKKELDQYLAATQIPEIKTTRHTLLLFNILMTMQRYGLLQNVPAFDGEGCATLPEGFTVKLMRAFSNTKDSGRNLFGCFLGVVRCLRDLDLLELSEFQ